MKYILIISEITLIKYRFVSVHLQQQFIVYKRNTFNLKQCLLFAKHLNSGIAHEFNKGGTSARLLLTFHGQHNF